MKHLRHITAAKAVKADALADLYNAVWQAWLDFVYTKKNQVIPTTS